MEIAFVTANRLQIELENKQGELSAKLVSFLIRRPKDFIGAMLVGNNIALVVYSIYFGNLILYLSGLDVALDPTLSLIAQTLISTIIILITGEFLPKAIFSSNPNQWLNLLAIPLIVVFFLLYVPAILITSLSGFLLRYILRANMSSDKVEFGRVDLDHFIREATRKVKHEDELDHEIQIFQNALDFRNLKARDCLIPRNEIIALDLADHIDELKNKFIETGLSKILIYHENIDNIIGYVHSYELFRKPTTIKSVLRPVSIVPEPMPANEVMEQFIRQKRNMAVVVDEFGGTSGILTMEDVVEQIFGDIEDEHDTEELIEIANPDGSYDFSARLEIDYINETYRLGLPESEDYDTLAGLVLHLYEDIPPSGAQVKVKDFIIEVVQTSLTRIELVHISKRD
jgi:CBS domain containing-hemolysin-like protein